jgi:hypothetical protein
LNYFFHPDAEKELDEAIAYYNGCQNDLGLEFSQKKFTWQFRTFFPFLTLGFHFLQIPGDV